MASRTRKTPHFLISTQSLPGAKFASIEAMRAYVHHDMEIERVLSEFADDGCEPAFWEDMRALGFDTNEIADLLANRTSRPARAYAMAGDC